MYGGHFVKWACTVYHGGSMANHQPFKFHKINWKIKWFAPFRLGRFRFEGMQFFNSFQSVQQIWI